VTQIFMSYSDQDRDFAQWIKRALTQAGIKTNLDDAESFSTGDFASAIRETVQAADALLVILSDNALSSNLIMLVIGMAQGLGKRVVAVAAPGAKPDPSLLSSLADCYIPDAASLKQPELSAQLQQALQGKQTHGTSAGA
jgi:TIR domain-containing protein